MKALAILCVLAAGCVDDVDPAWQLDHDRIIAVRATPPHIALGERSTFDALVAHKGGVTDVEQVVAMTAAFAPADLGFVVHYNVDHWEIDGTLMTAEQLDQARAELMLAADAPVPLDVLLQMPDSNGIQLFARKTVFLGDHLENPAMPPVTIAGEAPGATITIPKQGDTYMSVDAPDDWRVSWLTSCGTMNDDDQHTAFIRVMPEDRTDGELVVVVRDPWGGVAWQSWVISAQ